MEKKAIDYALQLYGISYNVSGFQQKLINGISSSTI